MKKIKNKTIIRFCLVLALPFFSHYTMAFTGECSVLGSSQNFVAQIKSDSIDADKNTAGTVLNDYADLSGTPYLGRCDCKINEDGTIEGVEDSSNNVTYFSAKAIGIEKVAINGLKYYSVPGNDNIYVGTELYLVQGGGGNLHQVPFASKSNNAPDIGSSSCSTEGNPGQYTFMTGSQGKIHLYIANPFYGEVNIPETLVAEIRGSKMINTIDSAPILSTVSIAGKIIMGSSCEINAGTTIDIPFGDIASSDVNSSSKAGLKDVTIEIDCKGVEPDKKMHVKFSGEINSNDSQKLKTAQDSGIAIKLNDESGVPMRFDSSNSTTIKMGGTSSSTQGKQTLQAYVVRQDEHRAPTPGKFDAKATFTITSEP